MISSQAKVLSSEISLGRLCTSKSRVSKNLLKLVPLLGVHGRGRTRVHHQLFARAATIFPNASRSFVSITSAGECEYRNGHPSATSTDPYRKNTEPSFPPPVTPYCAGMPFSFASATTRSTYCTGTILELSTARTTKPLPISASANRFDSSGESELTNVSIANTKSGVLPSFAACSAKAAAPFNPTSSSVDHTKVTSRPGRSGPSAFTAAIKAAQPTRSSKLRAFARVPSSGRYSFGIVTKSPSAIPSFAVSSFVFVPTYTWAGSSIALGPLGHSNPGLSHPDGNSITPPTVLLSFLCTSTTCPRKYCWYPPPSTSTCSRPSSSIFFTS